MCIGLNYISLSRREFDLCKTSPAGYEPPSEETDIAATEEDCLGTLYSNVPSKIETNKDPETPPVEEKIRKYFGCLH